MRKDIEICVLAAGTGTRMKSDKPKALHQLAGRPILAHLLETCVALDPGRIHVVIGSGAELVKRAFPGFEVNWVVQAEQRGTGHAMMQSIGYITSSAKVLILLGDTPLLQLQTLQEMLSVDCDLGVLTVDRPDP